MSIPGSLFLVSAPSGGGKTTLVTKLITGLQGIHAVSRVVTYTSRAARVGELHGIDYHFIARDQFESLIEQGFFLEWSNFYGTYYGTPGTIIEDMGQGKSYIAIVDRAGARAISQQLPAAILIWIYPPSMEILEERLRLRGTEREEQVQNRLRLAHFEMEEEKNAPFYHHYIMNDELENSLFLLKKMVIGALESKK